MSYQRVIPRDLFNEASLLKCYGQLAILLDNMDTAFRFPDDVPHFDIVQHEDSGAISIANLPLVSADIEYRLSRPLNSRRSWPLYAERANDPDADPVEVFDDKGNLTAEMQAILTRNKL